jgi:hypothetical protein
MIYNLKYQNNVDTFSQASKNISFSSKSNIQHLTETQTYYWSDQKKMRGLVSLW